MPEEIYHILGEEKQPIPVIKSDSISTQQPPSLLIDKDHSINNMDDYYLSPLTINNNIPQSNSSETMFAKEDIIIPIVEKQQQQEQTIIRKGFVLCTQMAQWYTRKKSTTRDIQLRKTRLRWRQFEAILYTKKIELYHISSSVVFKNKRRLAHVIHLSNELPYRRVRLSMISPDDCIWSLEFLHHETKRLISFHFQSSTLTEAQAWYMAVYSALPDLPIPYKKPIPPFVDIRVILPYEGNRHNDISIRIPLSLNISHTIRIQDLKPAILSLLQKNGLLCDWLNRHHASSFRLCWKRRKSRKQEEEEEKEKKEQERKKSLIQVVNQDPIEWLAESTELISPYLIEKSHILELHFPIIDKKKKNLLIQHKLNVFDGLLINKVWIQRKDAKTTKCKKSYFYTVFYGHHIFFFDKPFHYSTNTGTMKKANETSWFSATTGLLFQQRKLMISKQQQNNCSYQLGATSPQFTITRQESILFDSSQLRHARFVIDVYQHVRRAQPMLQDGTQQATSNTFELTLKSNNTKLYYEAQTTHAMLRWITLINNALKLNSSCFSYRGLLDGHKSILQSGYLYVKHHYKDSFKLQYCVLTKKDQHADFMIFDTMKKKSNSFRFMACYCCCCYCCYSIDDKEERESSVLYEKKKVLELQRDTTYVYSGDECILDQLIDTDQQQLTEPYRYYKDGLVTGQDKISDCVFVIWQLSQRHVVPDIRATLSVFKLGHRLGQRGSCWVFKARNRRERDEWMWTLHADFALL
ncbi:MAG: hypothetical protein EXX96DRAFT_648013 [Benjaminiella poitrasii]|nr:MAG: hypothetical protein EXX96DRAFT_648013 [Benjaminiella poitrasii]